MDFDITIPSEPEEYNKNDGNLDVFVSLNGETYMATFFTYKNINKLINTYKETGECLNGRYFWASDMILTEDLNMNTIREVTRDMIYDESFFTAFKVVLPDNK
jgi:hypothetical protein